jgi:hypothetical protein
MNVITNSHIGGVSEDGGGENATVLTQLVKIAMTAEIFRVFISPRFADFAIETGEFSVT